MDSMPDSIRADVNGTVQVRSPDLGSCGFITLDYLRVGVAHPVEVSAGENNRLRVNGLDKCRRIGKFASVVRAFQKCRLQGKGALDEICFRGFPDIPGEQHTEIAVFKTQDQRQFVPHLAFSMSDGLQDELRIGMQGDDSDLTNAQWDPGLKRNGDRSLF